jgi:hypothetical protein
LPDVDATPCPAHRLFLEQKALKGHFVDKSETPRRAVP